ncbi:hypothetical protein CWI39_0313p0020 [Hamiltosporidium magnivora]|uniref:Leucine-rich repeat-containing protein n=1 Tax=Hamiltosporidium magnivora TaxID=148818 RepID=A0A4Q9LH72_9MICR|nr:hypothetical protein CWI39_0313p0020 [Hamiltosporidium magnivora]
MNMVFSHTFRYVLKQNENNEILFFREEQKNQLADKETCDQQCGIIESDFELSYFLKLSKDILEISDNLNNFKFKCMLTVLKCLKAVRHKNNVKLLQAFICTDLTVENLSFIDECLNLNEKIDYVDFENVDINEFIKLKSSIYISYLSLDLNYYSMTEEFCRSLMLFEELETQKLYDYKVKEYTENKASSKYFFENQKSLTEIILINCEIQYLDMDKIFELEKLETLKINNCYVHNFHSDDLICFSSRNLKYLDLEDKSVDLSDNSYFLSELNCLEYLRISLQDVKYIKKFKKLKNISIVYSNMELRLNSNLFLSLPLNELYITDQNKKLLDKQRIKDCVYEYSSLRVRMWDR